MRTRPPDLTSGRHPARTPRHTPPAARRIDLPAETIQNGYRSESLSECRRPTGPGGGTKVIATNAVEPRPEQVEDLFGEPGEEPVAPLDDEEWV